MARLKWSVYCDGLKLPHGYHVSSRGIVTVNGLAASPSQIRSVVGVLVKASAAAHQSYLNYEAASYRYPEGSADRKEKERRALEQADEHRVLSRYLCLIER
jgi:hypothetical protein